MDAAREFGIDLSLIEESLRLTPEQRAIQHQQALELAMQMRAAYQSRQARAENDGTEQAVAGAVRR
ncbi:MAG TPA: hypothetical protein VIZ63_09940 [Povalibacter sp.]